MLKGMAELSMVLSPNEPLVPKAHLAPDRKKENSNGSRNRVGRRRNMRPYLAAMSYLSLSPQMGSARDGILIALVVKK